ncbi:MBL fold metallo-hydrolase [Reichenbachiella sp. MALMAid0571]|uniref:MBL fold metallo-hydrolase n=1 Tax=Reichenbachiella sp. MALMAid0571 TaxID=3143939 RepID=UPI0032DE84A2
MELIKALRKNEELLEDIKQASEDQSCFHLWWLGQSGFLIQWKGKHLLIDPYLSDSLTTKYAATEKPHVRMTELVVNPAHLDFIDVVTSSHNHTDHLDGDTLIPLIKANPNIQMVVPEANLDFVANRLGMDKEFFVDLNDKETTEVQGFTISGIPAAHEQLERDEKGCCRFMGYIIQFGGFSLYHSGDTIWHEDIVDALKRFKIDVAILPINGSDPQRKVAGNLSAEEAVRLGKIINAKIVIPCHYDMFTFNTADPKEFVKQAALKGQGYKVMRCGERWSSTDLK